MRELVRIGFAFVTLAFVCGTASAESVSSADAHAKCTNWTVNMANGTSHCGTCVYLPLMKPRCTFYVCDQDGCDTVTFERRRPKGNWSIRPSTVRRPG
jgi:hypothetical protein